MTRSLSYHLRCRSEGEGKRQAGGEREGVERWRTGGTGCTGSSSDETEHTLNTLKSKLQLLHVCEFCTSGFVGPVYHQTA